MKSDLIEYRYSMLERTQSQLQKLQYLQKSVFF
jgi:hypothetical protein